MPPANKKGEGDDGRHTMTTTDWAEFRDALLTSKNNLQAYLMDAMRNLTDTLVHSLGDRHH